MNSAYIRSSAKARAVVRPVIQGLTVLNILYAVVITALFFFSFFIDAWPERPPGLVTVRIDPESGKLAAAGAPDAIFEMVPAELVPPPDDAPATPEGQAEPGPVEELY